MNGSANIYGELPVWITGYIGSCPQCGREETLIFVLQDVDGKYEHCMKCGYEWSGEIQ